MSAVPQSPAANEPELTVAGVCRDPVARGAPVPGHLSFLMPAQICHHVPSGTPDGCPGMVSSGNRVTGCSPKPGAMCTMGLGEEGGVLQWRSIYRAAEVDFLHAPAAGPRS